MFRHSLAKQLLERGYDIRTVQKLLGHKDLKTTMIYTRVLNRQAKPSTAPWTICRGETKVSYTETIYPHVPGLADGLTVCIHMAYAGWGDGVLCRDFAAQRCYEETI